MADLTDVLAIKGKLDETAGKVDKIEMQMASVANRVQQTEAKVNAPRDDVDVARAIASAGLKAAIDRGGPFQVELQTLASVAPNDEAVSALQPSREGRASRSELIKRYSDAADQMLAVLNKPVAGQSLSDRLFKSAFSVIKVRPSAMSRAPVRTRSSPHRRQAAGRRSRRCAEGMGTRCPMT